MQPKLAHRDESAWELGDMAYELGDTLETGIIKAAQEGIKPGSNGYAAFITAFSRRVRSRQVSPARAVLQMSQQASQGGSAVVLTPDFSRTTS
ncbi:hypothetical protein [Noviherbaspirillum massiliense]|uniref:hypothetical protein n=1 Tax=Noviherbaspirillum massiliense TaxID=1465823 RepID=UPI000364E3F6|nr:hypothetical protein [Noviherbaspirillum massiliense]